MFPHIKPVGKEAVGKSAEWVSDFMAVQPSKMVSTEHLA